MAALCLTGTSRAVDIIWDGGDGEWNDFIGLWNGGQEAINVFNRTDGWEFNSNPIGSDVFINSGNVTYDTNIFDDFRFNSNGPGNGGTLTIGQGASLSMDYELRPRRRHRWQLESIQCRYAEPRRRRVPPRRNPTRETDPLHREGYSASTGSAATQMPTSKSISPTAVASRMTGSSRLAGICRTKMRSVRKSR